MEVNPKVSIFLVFFLIIAFCGCTTTSSQPTSNIHQIKPQEISGPMTISQPGYYQLIQDVVPTSINRSKSGSCFCFHIKSADIVFDGMGHVIDGSKINPQCPEWSDGFYFQDQSGDQSKYPNVVIRNITVSNWQSGIELNGVHNFYLENVTITGSKNGVTIHSSSNVTLSQNKVTKNSWVGIWGRDNEYVTIDNNIVADNPSWGIYLDGQQETPPEITIFKQTIQLFPYTYNKKTTSGNGYYITNNSVHGNRDAISIQNSASNIIENNHIFNNSGAGIRLYNVDNTLVRNNTFSNNGQNKTEFSAKVQGFFSFSIGTILLFIISALGTTINAASKIIFSRVMKWFSKNYGIIETKISVIIEKSRASKLLTNSSAVSVAGAIVFGGAYTLISSLGQKIEVFAIMTIIGGVVVIVPRVIQYIAANKSGIQAVYRLWWEGILVIFLTASVFGSVFGQPVRTVFGEGDEYEKRKFALVMLAGPIVSLILSASFLLLYQLKGNYTSLALTGLNMSLLSALVSLMPISPMEGKRVFDWNKLVWVLVFFPILLVYGYYFMIPHNIM